MSCQLHYDQGYTKGEAFHPHWVPMEIKSGNGAFINSVAVTRQYLSARQKSRKYMVASKACATAARTTSKSQLPLPGAAA